jgi:hypothetical protein
MSETIRALMFLIAIVLLAIGLVIFAALPGCTTIPAAVDRYCATATEAERAAMRERFNAQIAPNQIKVDCYDRRH